MSIAAHERSQHDIIYRYLYIYASTPRETDCRLPIAFPVFILSGHDIFCSIELSFAKPRNLIFLLSTKFLT